ncbi:hypothetical protein [Rhizobium paknamense]|uniref:Glycosyltransferase family 1 protein n=1 Tax=Rhizobium paknamense TaxID=1206817 RepID=A0ABU0I8I7_9HYPH|nr:hypothetical protein [Rhizobium paknamense]MDQ0454545.1 hypothetical protein [Rhizobium paknamense]
MKVDNSNRQRTQIVCLGMWADYEDFFWQQADQTRFDVTVLHIKKLAQKNPFYKITPAFQRHRLYYQVMAQVFARFPNAHFIVNEREEVLRYIVAHKPAVPISIIIRNPVAAKGVIIPFLKEIIAAGHKVISFDPQDCRAYGFEPYRQYIAPVAAIPHREQMTDFSFLGREKGRSRLIEGLGRRLGEKGFSVSLKFTDRKIEKKHWWSKTRRDKRSVPYPDYLAENLSARCIIDILQSGQEGLTLRPLEAMIYGRKLLTNNRHIVSEAFYHPNNIFVLDTFNSLEGIEAFMAKPFVEIDPAIKALYSVDAVISQCLTKGAPAFVQRQRLSLAG